MHERGQVTKAGCLLWFFCTDFFALHVVVRPQFWNKGSYGTHVSLLTVMQIFLLTKYMFQRVHFDFSLLHNQTSVLPCYKRNLSRV